MIWAVNVNFGRTHQIAHQYGSFGEDIGEIPSKKDSFLKKLTNSVTKVGFPVRFSVNPLEK